MFTLILALAMPANATETTVAGDTRLGVAALPGGLISDNRFNVRHSLSDSEHILMQDTYVGGGAKLAVSPAFAEVGPRLSFAPLAIFDVDVQASYLRYFGGNVGLMPFNAPVNKLERDRNPREDGFASDALSLTASPTLKAKVGRFIAIDTWSISALHINRPEGITSDFTYEPYRDLVVAFDDVTIEHQAIGLYEAQNDRKMLRFGPTVRNRRALRSQDHSTAVGGMIMARPGDKAGVPTLVGQVLGYAVDADRSWTVAGPAVQGLAKWDIK